MVTISKVKGKFQGPEVGVCPRLQAQWGWPWDGAGCWRRRGSRSRHVRLVQVPGDLWL